MIMNGAGIGLLFVGFTSMAKRREAKGSSGIAMVKYVKPDVAAIAFVGFRDVGSVNLAVTKLTDGSNALQWVN
jgi:hypothetical protein